MNWLAARFELRRGGANGHLPVMEGMRGLAVLLVFLVHYTTLMAPYNGDGMLTQALAALLHNAGATGVDLFFILSGYLIYGAVVGQARPVWPFLRRRLVRIYPAFAAVFALYLALSLLLPSYSKLPAGLGPALLYLAANALLLPGMLPMVPMIKVAWSLSYEMFFYLALPAIAAVSGLRTVAPARRALLYCLFAGAALLAYAPLGSYLELLMFVAGMLVYDTLDSAPRPGSSVGLMALLLGLAAAVPDTSNHGVFALQMLAVGSAFYVFCLVCLGQPDCLLARALAVKPLRWLGNMSYSYYLLHGLALKAAVAALALLLAPGSHGALLHWALLLPMWALTLLPAVVLFLLVERPYSLRPS